jgi:hypothetical protein
MKQPDQTSGEQKAPEKPVAYNVWRSIWSEMGTLEAIADALPDGAVGIVVRGYQEHGLPEILPDAEKALRDAGGEPDNAHAEKTFHRAYQITSLLIREHEDEDVPKSEYRRDPDVFYAEAHKKRTEREYS